jgi:hypothetical protein
MKGLINDVEGFTIEMQTHRMVITPLTEVSEAYLRDTLGLGLARSGFDRGEKPLLKGCEPREVVRGESHWLTGFVGSVIGGLVVAAAFWLLS